MINRGVRRRLRLDPWQRTLYLVVAAEAITLIGFGIVGGVLPVANAVIAQATPGGRQGSIYGVSASLNALGRSLGPVLGTFVVSLWSIGGVFPTAATLLGLLTIAVSLTTRSLREPVPAADGE